MQVVELEDFRKIRRREFKCDITELSMHFCRSYRELSKIRNKLKFLIKSTKLHSLHSEILSLQKQLQKTSQQLP